MKIYEIGTGYTPIPAKIAAATESIVEELTRSFIKNGEDAEIIDIAAEDRGEIELPITEVTVPKMFTKSDVSLGIMHKLKRVVYSIALSQRLKRILKNTEERVVLHFHNQYNLFFFLKLVSKKLRKKALIAYTNHNGVWSLPLEQSETILKKRYFQEIEAMKKADVVFALNEKMRKNIIGYLNVLREKVVKIDNGVNTELYHPLSEEKTEDIKKERFDFQEKQLILQVGSINENKGQARAVELLAPALKSDSSLVYGYIGEIVSEEYQQLIKKTARDLEVEKQVVYLGAVSPGCQMNEIYNTAAMTIFLSKYESFGLVCIESMAAGVPVLLCSDSLLNFGDGCIEGSPEDIQKNINDILNNNLDKKKKIARENAVNNYSWGKIAQDYYGVFEQAVK
jgi:glycosyltransferase involved in cell wall biosynthesis